MYILTNIYKIYVKYGKIHIHSTPKLCFKSVMAKMWLWFSPSVIVTNQACFGPKSIFNGVLWEIFSNVSIASVITPIYYFPASSIEDRLLISKTKTTKDYEALFFEMQENIQTWLPNPLIHTSLYIWILNSYVPFMPPTSLPLILLHSHLTTIVPTVTSWLVILWESGCECPQCPWPTTMPRGPWAQHGPPWFCQLVKEQPPGL